MLLCYYVDCEILFEGFFFLIFFNFFNQTIREKNVVLKVFDKFITFFSLLLLHGIMDHYFQFAIVNLEIWRGKNP